MMISFQGVYWMIYLRGRRWRMKNATADPMQIGTTSQGCPATTIEAARIASGLVLENQRPRAIAVKSPDAIATVNQPSFALRRWDFGTCPDASAMRS